MNTQNNTPAPVIIPGLDWLFRWLDRHPPPLLLAVLLPWPPPAHLPPPWHPWPLLYYKVLHVIDPRKN